MDRLWSFVAKSDGCWQWTGTKNAAGYGMIAVAGKKQLAHRLVYQSVHGVLKKHHVVCHSCDNPGCVNPDHLWQGTQRDNIRDQMDKGRMALGEKRANSKLTEDAVRDIRASAHTLGCGGMHAEVRCVVGGGHKRP